MPSLSQQKKKKNQFSIRKLVFVVNWGCKTFNCLYFPYQHLELKITTSQQQEV